MPDGVHEQRMRRALECARKAWGCTYPNPLVGAVICEDGRIVAEGFHARAGEPHAEIMALRALGRRPKSGAVLYVTLEPCCTYGRTPPCTEAILQAGIRTVVVGATDPNPAHAGRGLAQLRAAGVAVIDGVLADPCEDLNLVFNHWIVRRKPLVAAKCALSLDGRIACRNGASRWITGTQARDNAHLWRDYFPAIAVGSGTALADDPSLTVRLPNTPERCPTARFVFDRRLRLAKRPDLKLLSDRFKERTIVVCSSDAPAQALSALDKMKVAYWKLPKDDFFEAFIDECAKREICGVFCEGGSALSGALLKARALDYLFCYRAPLLMADHRALSAFDGLAPLSLENAVRLKRLRRETFGDDDLLRGYVEYPPNH